MRSRNKIHDIKGLIGRNIMIRTVTMILTGYVDDITDKDILLTKCSWIPETDRWSEFVKNGAVNSCEPYPEDTVVFVNRSSYIDMCQIDCKLPREPL